ncbi:MAG: hypothetical protein FWF03_01395 [Defluviitaleaceae bacterium]|nr:hypothetical protein [Defluviitaleaceae bacterium]
MIDAQAFYQHLIEIKKQQSYVDTSRVVLESLFKALGSEPPSSGAINAFVRSRWSGYVSRDKATYRILNDYANFSKNENQLFADAFREHVRETFEGEARKAVKAYKNAIVPIPKNARIDPVFLNGLTNDEFVTAFKSLQNFLCAVYDGIGRGSPFEWGWPDWKAITWEGINHNRVIMVLDAMAKSGQMDGDLLVVDKKRFGGHGVCKPIAKTNLLLEGFIKTGLHIVGIYDKKSDSFTVSCPDNPNLISVLRSYFINGNDDRKNRVNALSFRFAENPETQTRETFFLAKTDGEPEELRKIYYWLYDEAVRHGFTPQGCESIGCYSYKKGDDEWLLLGSGHSYHEDAFLHSAPYKIAAKVRFLNVFKTHPDEIGRLLKKHPDAVGRPWQWCFCKTKPPDCKNRVVLKKNGQDRIHCARGINFYFHDPDFDDVKTILELYKIENGIKPV